MPEETSIAGSAAHEKRSLKGFLKLRCVSQSRNRPEHPICDGKISSYWNNFITSYHIL